MNEKELFERLDEIIVLLKEAGKGPTLFMRVLNGLATVIGIFGVLSIIDIIKSWIGG